MATTVRITGLIEIRNALKLVSADAPKQLAALNQRVGQIVVDKAKELAPKGPHQGGGTIIPIASSIRASRSGTTVAVSVGGNGTPHAVVTEFGGSIPRRGFGGQPRDRRGRSVQHAGNVTHVRKQAYLFPAVDAEEPAIEASYLEMVDQLLEEFEA